jgi:hypothetical protein
LERKEYERKELQRVKEEEGLMQEREIEGLSQ